MKTKVSNAMLMGLVATMGAVGAGALWTYELHNPLRAEITVNSDPLDGVRDFTTNEEIEALATRIGHVLERIEDMDQRLGETAQSMTVVQHQLARLENNDGSTQLPEADREDLDASPIESDSNGLDTQGEHKRPMSEQVDAKMNAQAELIETRIHSESPDPSWTDAAEIALEDKFMSGNIRQFELVDTECASTLCRVRFYFSDIGSTQIDNPKLTQIVSALPWTGEAWLRFENTENGEAVLYLAREGHTLPR